MNKDDIVPVALLGAGLFLIGKAVKKGPRKLKDRTGEPCNPKESAPYGYECGQVVGGWELMEERGKFLGFGSYNNKDGIDTALRSLGFSDGNLRGFQMYMSLISEWDLRKDGQLDRDTVVALEEAEGLLSRGEWLPPRGPI
jgi:hypothetical protein